MKRLWKMLTVLAILLSSLLLFATASALAAEPQGKTVSRLVVQGRELSIAPEMGRAYTDANGQVMVPLRALTDALDLTLRWDSAVQTATVEGGINGTVALTAGSNRCTVGSAVKELEAAPVLLPPGQLHVPVRGLCENLGAAVWAKNYSAGQGKYTWYIWVFFPKGNAVPTPPPWAEGDYTPTAYTSAYQPEHWASIQALRRRTLNGENVLEDLRAFYTATCIGTRGTDAGIAYECTLIVAQQAMLGYVEEKIPIAPPTDGREILDDAQRLSFERWYARCYAATGRIPANLAQMVANGGRGGRYYEGGDSWTRGLDHRAFFAEPYFDAIRDDPRFQHYAGDRVYYDNWGKLGYLPPYAQNGTTMFDVNGLCWGLNWDVCTKEIQDRRQNTAFPLSLPPIPAGEVWLIQNGYELGLNSKAKLSYRSTGPARTIVLTVGSSKVTDNGLVKDMGFPVESHVMGWANGSQPFFSVPKEFLTKVLGEQVRYDAERHAWFVGREADMGACNLQKWAMGMNAIIARANRWDPWLPTLFPRSYVTPQSAPGEIISAYYLLSAWGGVSANSVRSLAKNLTRTEGDVPAWNLFRAAQVIWTGYAAGYIDQAEALRLTVPVAEGVKVCYSDWASACRDYLDGRIAWMGADSEENQVRESAYQELLALESTAGLIFDDSLFQQPVVGAAP